MQVFSVMWLVLGIVNQEAKAFENHKDEAYENHEAQARLSKI